MKEIQEAIKTTRKIKCLKSQVSYGYDCTHKVCQEVRLRACAEHIRKSRDKRWHSIIAAIEEGAKARLGVIERKALQFVVEQKIEAYKRGEAKGRADALKESLKNYRNGAYWSKVHEELKAQDNKK